MNAAPLLLSMHLSFLADLFGLRLRTFLLVHRACGLMTTAHVVLHSIVIVARGVSMERSNSVDMYPVTVSDLVEFGRTPADEHAL